MIWLDNIQQLQYYSNLPGAYCYCELLIFPNDLTLQGKLGAGFTGPVGAPFLATATIKFQLYSADGKTLIGNITSSFDYYFTKDSFSNTIFNARLKTFPAAMCDQCFIVRVTVNRGDTVLFDKYTEQYCMDSCCSYASGITVEQDNVVSLPITDGTTIAAIVNEAVNKCGRPIIRIRVAYDCYDKKTGDFYSTPNANDIIGGVYGAIFPFTKITNIQATFKRNPRDIIRQISFNCRTQKAESVAPYELQSFEEFPFWKMDEIEKMFHAPHIFIQETEYVFKGGKIFEQLPIPQINILYQRWKLKVPFEDCLYWQVYGCSDTCNNTSTYFGILSAPLVGKFYNENRVLVGTSFEELLIYYGSQDGVTEAKEIPAGEVADPELSFYKIFKVSSTGYIPSFFYVDDTYPANKVFGLRLDNNDPDYSLLFGGLKGPKFCPAPVIGQVTVEDQTCTAPVIGDITVEDDDSDTSYIESNGQWIVDGDNSSVSKNDNVGTITLVSTNAGLPAPAPPLPILGGDIVAVIGPECRPTVTRIITHDINSDIPAGSSLIITPDGLIQWLGEVTSGNGGGSTVSFTDIKYNL